MHTATQQAKAPRPTPFPLRLKPEIEEQARRLAGAQDRSINWMLNELVRQGLASLQAQKESAPAASTAGAPI
ncbi:hypothetical protein QPK31_23195 [Massilia sp. YIM B02769]|uniref:hypothetical protein n=1 Tax=Massilia sp. YIM B02769 TaxID=3050129 RepID=UPI0025B68FB3|nr:hypothetical protein [Massilia sp. YIM B02769]MDN4061129.1 hypothetical protein [Massilia sp. YIM B02769]